MARSNIEPQDINLAADQQGGSVPVEIDITPDPMEEELGYTVEGEEDLELEEDSVEVPHDSNLAELMEEAALTKLALELNEAYDEDEESRSEWLEIVKDGIDLLGFKLDETDEPFVGACGVTHPLLAQSVVKFQAKAYKELFPSGGPVRTIVMGDPDPEREQQATRVRNFMNYQTTIEMPEYGPELDRMLFYVGLFGFGVKKVYYDAGLGRMVSEFVKGTDFVTDYYTTSLEQSERYTHKMIMSGNKIKKLQLAGQYRDLEMEDDGEVTTDVTKDAEDELVGLSAPLQTGENYTILEMHVNLELEGFEHPDGLALPYVVTFIKDSDKVLAIRKNWQPDDPTMVKDIWFTPYNLIPGLGFYGYGYIHLIGGLAKTATSSLRQLVDAGSFATIPAGFKAHGLRVIAPDEPIQPGEWREINAPAGDLSKALIPLPYREPSATLFNLLTMMVDAGKEFADATDQVVSEASNYGPVGTTMALMENSARLYSAIHKRLHAAQGQELRLLARLNAEYMPDAYPYETSAGTQKVFKKDFDLTTVDVVPVSDPNMPTEAHRIARINAIMSIAAQDPAAHNMNAIRIDLYNAMGVENPERYLAEQQQPFNGDPITENSNAIQGMAIAAKMEENHDAHIKVHSDILNNPAYSESPALRIAMMAHVQEHLAMKYKMEMLQMLGDPQMAQAVMSGQELPPEIQNQIAIAAANTSDTLMSLDIAKEKALAGEPVDPIMVAQDRELSLRESQATHEQMIDSEKLELEKKKLAIEDENKDKDRAMRKEVAAIQAMAWKSQGDRNN